MKRFFNLEAKKYLVLIFFSLAWLSAAGQRQTANQHNSWYMYFGNHALTDKWLLHTEYQFRRSGLIQD